MIRDFNKARIVRLNAFDVDSGGYASELVQKYKYTSRLGIDVGQISGFNNNIYEFIQILAKEREISIFNVKSEDLLPIYLMNFDFGISIYMTEQDFLANKNVVVRRRFRLCKKSA